MPLSGRSSRDHARGGSSTRDSVSPFLSFACCSPLCLTAAVSAADSYEQVNKPRPYWEVAAEVVAKGAFMPKKRLVPLLREVSTCEEDWQQQKRRCFSGNRYF